VTDEKDSELHPLRGLLPDLVRQVFSRKGAVLQLGPGFCPL